MATTDTAFTGSIPALYDRCLGPLVFEPYAEEVARRAASLAPKRILETAAGTGIVTEALHRAIADAEIISTDLNPTMLEVAAKRIVADKVSFEPADAQDLRFPDASFDLVVCQFGAMFFPDKVKASAEARRVLCEGGHYIAVIWDKIDRNPASHVANDAVAALYPNDPPSFLARTPFGYSDPERIERDFHAAGFARVEIVTVALRGELVSARDAATGIVAGCPLAVEVQQRDPNGLAAAVDAAARALEPLERDGTLACLSAHVVTATK
jgi:ubiquinone/menaquinone biosynthesis C-methylase UbiE